MTHLLVGFLQGNLAPLSSDRILMQLEASVCDWGHLANHATPYFNPLGPTPGALQGDDYELEYYDDGYPRLPACLDRRAA